MRNAAIRVAAGPGREDRIRRGYYVALRERERRQREKSKPQRDTTDSYLPRFLR